MIKAIYSCSRSKLNGSHEGTQHTSRNSIWRLLEEVKMKQQEKYTRSDHQFQCQQASLSSPPCVSAPHTSQLSRHVLRLTASAIPILIIPVSRSSPVTSHINTYTLINLACQNIFKDASFAPTS
ncbi:hypothetical protein E2C01_062372 [Portunus trituberculatus]|uniref:Uncharacterized protein n=1 Tax=Portunus trituberculatus TaxID=210409 RepID=A0A5B7HEY2_PORTR|nr:hypothetical protein [Portunus trituberculatus]